MKPRFYGALLVCALIASAGCKKSIDPSSVALSSGKTKANFHLPGGSFQPTPTTRVIAFDIGTGQNTLLAYDVGTNLVQMIQYNGNGSFSVLWTTQGLQYDQNVYGFNAPAPADNYTMNGGDQIIAFDYSDDGRMDHLLLYTPGPSKGRYKVLSYVGNGTFHQVDGRNGGGIGGYDLGSPYDKIIAYDHVGKGHKDCLMCYRPGFGNCWVIQNQGSYSLPNWVGIVKGSSGIGGFDLRGITDQIITVDNPTTPANAYLVCYRPGYGYVWFLQHPAGTQNYQALWTSRSGIIGLDMMQPQDRMIAIDAYNTGKLDRIMTYRPGMGVSQNIGGVATWNGSSFYFLPNQGTYWSANTYGWGYNPYASSSGIGDHAVAFSGSGSWGSNLLLYTNGVDWSAALTCQPGQPGAWQTIY